MTLNELIEALAELRDAVGGDIEVRMAYQPNYPLQSYVAGVWCNSECDEDDDEGMPIVYIVDGGQVHDDPYAPADAFSNLPNL